MKRCVLYVAPLCFFAILLLFGCSLSDSTGSSADPQPKWCKRSGNCGVFTDSRDRTTYRWTKIGTQIWMAENLNFGGRVNGANNQQDATASSAEKYCYDDDELNCTTYGGIYQWHSAMALPYECNSEVVGTSSCIVNTPHRGICPTGWHVPSREEWTTLQEWVDFDNDGELNDNEGTSLKSISGWDKNGNGTDDYGWTGLSIGFLLVGSFVLQDNYGYWWSSSGNFVDDAWNRYLSYETDNLFESNCSKYYSGFSIRCVKD